MRAVIESGLERPKGYSQEDVLMEQMVDWERKVESRVKPKWTDI